MGERDHLRAGLAQLPTFALEQMAEANRALVRELRRRLAAGEPVAPMYAGERLQRLLLAAEVAEELAAARPDRTS